MLLPQAKSVFFFHPWQQISEDLKLNHSVNTVTELCVDSRVSCEKWLQKKKAGLHNTFDTQTCAYEEEANENWVQRLGTVAGAQLPCSQRLWRASWKNKESCWAAGAQIQPATTPGEDNEELVKPTRRRRQRRHKGATKPAGLNVEEDKQEQRAGQLRAASSCSLLDGSVVIYNARDKNM